MTSSYIILLLFQVQIHSTIYLLSNSFVYVQIHYFQITVYVQRTIIMRRSSLGGGRIMRRTLSVRLSVCLSVCLSVRPVIVTERHVAPPSELQWHTCTFRHALRAAYRTAISAAQIYTHLHRKFYLHYTIHHYSTRSSISGFAICQLSELIYDKTKNSIKYQGPFVQFTILSHGVFCLSVSVSLFLFLSFLLLLFMDLRGLN